MIAYTVHRLRESARHQFRWAPHTAGVTVVKPKDYAASLTVEAESPYAAWLALRDTENALQVGDVLETSNADLRIFKYIGFEEARWFVPGPIPGEVPVEVT